MAGKSKKESEIDEIQGVVKNTVSEESYEQSETMSLNPIPTEDCISSGITTLDLNLSGNSRGGFRKGSVVQYMALEGVGKTAVALKACITASSNPVLKDYKIYYLDKEGGLNFNLSYFGKEAEERIIILNPRNSKEILSSLEKTYLWIISKLKESSCIIVMDSLNSFLTEGQWNTEEENEAKVLRAIDNDKEVKLANDKMADASQVTAKNLAMINELVKENGSLFILISQYRDKLNAGPYEDPNRTSGGKAIQYYADYRIKFSASKTIKKEDMSGKEIIVGYNLKSIIIKNRGNGMKLDCDVDYIIQKGIDNRRAVFHYLADYKAVKKAGAYYSAQWLTGSEDNFKEIDFCKMVKTTPELFEKMKDKAQEVWRSNMESLFEEF